MNYWEDMNDKYGFNDGEAVPPDAEECREVYITAINALAEALGSTHRVYPYDRPGVHNWCLVVTGPKDMPEGDIATVPDSFDPALELAIDTAQTLGLDQYVRTEVVVERDALNDFLTNNLDRLV